MDSYQAIYDAIRSKISNGNIGEAIKEAIRNANISFYFEQGCRTIQEAGIEMQRPSVLFHPSIFQDGNKWCALYGKNLQEGIAGFGKTPNKAMRDFDNNWNLEIIFNNKCQNSTIHTESCIGCPEADLCS